MINNEKIGSYIKELRTKNKLTQEELADKIYVSRQAVSNWERGEDVPSVDNVKNICILFNVSMVDIYAGEKVKDIKTLNDVIHSLITLEIKKSKKIIIISSILIFLLIIMFLAYYFITYYNNISVYIIKGDSNKYDINGIINKSVNNVYMNLETNDVFDRICLAHNDERIICQSNSNYIIFTEYNGYNEIMPLDNKEFNNYLKDLYIIVKIENEEEKIKLDFMKYFENNNLLKDSYNDVNNNDNYELKISNVPEYIKNNFEYNEKDNNYYLNIKDSDMEINVTYYPSINSLSVNEIDDNMIKRYIFNNDIFILESYDVINKFTNEKIISFANINNNENNKNKKKIYDYFKENYVDKYLK